MPGPIDAFAAHLDLTAGGAIHPARHEMAADAGLRARTLRHAGRGIVRATGAKIGNPLDRVGSVRQQLRLREVDHVVAPVESGTMLRQPVRHGLDQPRWAQFADRGNLFRAERVPLAGDDRAHAMRAVVKQIAQLALHDRRLFLDHEDLRQIPRKINHARLLDRKRQADFIQAHTGRRQVVQRQLEATEHLDQIVVRLAAGDDADTRVRRRDDLAVDAVDRSEDLDRLELVLQPHLDLGGRRVLAAIVQTVDRWLESGLLHHLLRRFPGRDTRQRLVDIHRRPAFDDFRERRQSDPCAAEARQRPTVQTELQIFRHAAG